MKPSFLECQKSVKSLGKCLIKKAEKGASSQNDALMKKGLRLSFPCWCVILEPSEPCPDEEGIKTHPSSP